MKERGMIFNADMVRAILDGRKTQTRRPIKNQPLVRDGFWHMDGAGWGNKFEYIQSGNGVRQSLSLANHCPFGQPGDRLWVRETWADVNLEGIPTVAYRADDDVYSLMDDKSFLDEDGAFNYDDPRVSKYDFAAWYSDLISGTEGNWRPSIHMPRWASRITLEITGVRVERLNAISEMDAQAEGVEKLRGGFWRHYQPGWTQHQLSARGSFVTLWKSIYGEESWNSNQWVWVVEFRRVA